MTKAISLDNLAQFKAKCDETYAKVGEGGITLSQVIAREETLPAATADSPDFVQTPDGTLYRKKAVEGGVTGVLTSSTIKGVFKIDSNPYIIDVRFDVPLNFSSNNTNFTAISADSTRGTTLKLMYGSTTVYNGTWTDTAYQTVNFGDVEQSFDSISWFYDYFRQVATPVTPSVSYEYVAQQDAGAGGGESTVTGYSVTVSSTYDIFLRDNKGILKKHTGNSGQKTYQNITEIYYYYSPGSDYFNISNPTYVAKVLAAEKNTTKYYHDFLQGDISITISAGGGGSTVG